VNTSVIWIAPPSTPKTDSRLGKVRAAGLLPVRVDSADAALQVLTQFRAGVVVYQAQIENGAGDCERLVATGAAVVAVIAEPRYSQIYLSVGCAAVVTDRCPGTVLADILKSVAAGKRNLVWPATAAGSAPATAAG
jgi:hypothetical protein